MQQNVTSKKQDTYTTDYFRTSRPLNALRVTTYRECCVDVHAPAEQERQLVDNDGGENRHEAEAGQHHQVRRPLTRNAASGGKDGQGGTSLFRWKCEDHTPVL